MIRKYIRPLIAFIVVLTLISGGYLLAQRITKTASDYDMGIAAYQRGHYHTALYDFEARANQGDKVAQFCLAFMYKHSYGMSNPKPEEARKWYTAAAEQGYPAAQNNLGVLYVRRALAAENISKHTENAEIGEKWLRIAAEKDYPPAQFNLYISLLDKNVKWLEKAAEKDYPPAQNELGSLYYSGKNDIVRNPEKAMEFFRKAANKGNAKAQFHLGVCSERGMGVKQNDKEALKWYAESAKQGYEPAQFNLGAFFHFGRGVAENEDEAIRWYFKAAINDEVDAQNNLAVLYKNLGDEAKAKSETEAEKSLVNLWNKHKGDNAKREVDFEEANRWYEMANRWFLRAAQQSNSSAQRNIAIQFEEGLSNITKDAAEAYFWYSLTLKDIPDPDSVNIKDFAAKVSEARERISKSLTDEQINEINKRIENWKPKQLYGSGTGFYISEHYILTNAHVVLDENRKPLYEFRIPYRRVELVAWDRDVDLALLYDERGNTDIATFRRSPVSFGEEVSMFGYPRSDIYSYEGDIVPGIVSGTSFEVDDSQFQNRFKYTAPTQPGNSGGPVFDSAGNVIGVCTSQGFTFYNVFVEDTSISGNRIRQLINRAQNINFAIKPNVVEKFISNAKAKLNLDDLDFPVQTRFSFSIDRDGEIQVQSISLPEQRAKAKDFTVPVICYKNKAEPPLGVVEIRIEELEQ